MTEHEVMCRLTADLDRVRGERNDAYVAIDDMVDVIGKLIIKIAYDNRDFICSRCLSTAYALFGLMEKYAREEDAADIRDLSSGKNQQYRMKLLHGAERGMR